MYKIHTRQDALESELLDIIKKYAPTLGQELGEDNELAEELTRIVEYGVVCFLRETGRYPMCDIFSNEFTEDYDLPKQGTRIERLMHDFIGDNRKMFSPTVVTEMKEWLDAHTGQDLILTAFHFRTKFSLTPEIGGYLIGRWAKGTLEENNDKNN